MSPRSTAFAAALLASSVALADDAVQLKLVPSGATEKLGGYAPQRLLLSSTRPNTLTKVPEGLEAPVYGVLPVAGPEGAVFHVVVDEPDGKPSRIFVDSNGNGDLTDDAAATWAAQGNGVMKGTATIDIGTKEAAAVVTLGVYRFDKNDPKRAELKDKLLYYGDYMREGDAKLGDRTFHVMLTDVACAGDFRGRQIDPADEKASSGVALLVDVNGNGRIDSRGERFDVRKPFNIGGTTYELAGLARDGSTFTFAKSDRKVDEVAPPPDHSVGRTITAFEAKTMDGKTVKFPGDYKGKVVMLDFWATWCGPCMAEVPGLVAAYDKYKEKGFEVLGVTLDNPNSDQKINDVMAKKQMSWPQVYDGGGWKAAVAQLYGINSIPATFLVDGDTGEILAVGGSLRGAELGKSIEAALAKKQK